MTEDERSLENAMSIANDIARWRRKRRFEKALPKSTKPVLVAEGDSWFQFPLLIKDTIEQLGDDYLISCYSAAGDTALNMVFGAKSPGKTEFMAELGKLKGRVSGFLFSAAGNDIIGEDMLPGQAPVPVLRKILKRPTNSASENPADYINMAELGNRIAFLQGAYQKVIDEIRADPDFATLPIFVHGYDVPFPFPWEGDTRNPSYAKKDHWLGSAFDAHGIGGDRRLLRRQILAGLVGALYDLLYKVAGDAARTHVYVVDCRGAMPNVALWADEIHGTDEGFRRVGMRFKEKVAQVVPTS
jgi:N-acetylmuramoyl-L-alanine amidase